MQGVESTVSVVVLHQKRQKRGGRHIVLGHLVLNKMRYLVLLCTQLILTSHFQFFTLVTVVLLS